MQVKCQNTEHWIKAMEYCKNNLLYPGDSSSWNTALKATLLCDDKFNNRYIENPTKEAYSKLIELGYIPYENKTFEDMFFKSGIYLVIVDNEIHSCDDAHIKFVKATQMWFHNNDFVFENPDPHAELRKKYETIEDKRFVEVECYEPNIGWEALSDEYKEEFLPDRKYRLKYYDLDWSKFLAWQYTNNEFITIEASDDFRFKYKTIVLFGYADHRSKPFISPKANFKYCRIPKNTPIRDEWLKEI